MHEQMIDESVPHSAKTKCVQVNKKWIFLAMGSIIGAVSLIVIFASALANPDYDNDPPGTPLPRKCGQRTDESEWPWTVEIYVRHDPTWEHAVGLGTLINDRYVLSSPIPLTNLDFHHLRVLLGETTFVHTVDDSYFEDRVYREVIERELFKSNGIIDGIHLVLLRMDQPVSFNGRIQPVCLPWVQPQIPQQLTILPDDETGKLFSSSVQLVSNQNCMVHWYRYMLSVYSDSEEESQEAHDPKIDLCVRKTDSYNEHCHAPHGSPLLGVFRDGDRDRFVQYGAKLHGDCTDGLQIYANVTERMEWIRQVVTRKDGTLV